MKISIKKITITTFFTFFALTSFCQQNAVFEQLNANPQKAYGNDCPYPFESHQLTKTPVGYTPFYISHYARHGSRYYWTDNLYKELDTLLTTAHNNHQLTEEGEKFYKNFMAAKDELSTGVSELTQLGWEQHQKIARQMYNNFPEVFKKGGDIYAISSLVGRCVLSMSAFCQELVQCNPKLEIREQSSRFTLDGVVPSDRQNPVKHSFPRVKPRFEKNWDKIPENNSVREKILSRVFTSTDGLPGNLHHIGSNLINLYTSLPNILHEGMMGNIIIDDEIVKMWERSNLGSYAWVFGPQYETIPILQDIMNKADAVIDGKINRVADLRFGHDTYIGPLTIFMGINGADIDPEDPFEVKNCYQNWQTCKACNIQLIFYRNKKNPNDILVKCLLNGAEAKLPVQTTNFPYYKWLDFKSFYNKKIETVKTQK
ncbi:MAG: histidine-type phosphatase [Bacteroidales bacterium]|nr:histidine-type phosphatase [Bacteroidales bacterium]